jgi:hypothetical protein
VSDQYDIITLDDAKTQLNISTTNYDAELAGFVTSASYMWKNRVGPVIPQAFNEWYGGGRPQITLRRLPIMEIMSVFETYGSMQYELTQQNPGQGFSAYAYMFDPATGVVQRLAAGVATSFTGGYRNINVQYMAGYGPIGSGLIPGDIQLAVKLLVQHLWTTQRGGGKRPGQGGDDMPNPEAAYSWPQRVAEIANGYLVEGIA